MRYNIIVVGAGGTGTYFLKEFSRYLAGNCDSIKSFHIFDGDIVEDKNLIRQAFTTDDIGLNKALVMADVLDAAFHVPWRAHTSYLEDLSQLPAGGSNTVNILICAADNHAVRLLLEEAFEKASTCIYLDAANEFSTGEVIFAYKKDGCTLSPVRSSYFPAIKNADLRKRTEMSCEELNEVAPQHIRTNMQAGNILLTETTSILEGVVHPGMVTFDVETFYQEYTPYGSEVVEW